MKSLRFFIIYLISIVMACQAYADGSNYKVIRDTEIENVIRLFMKPLLYSANLIHKDQELSQLEIYIIQSNDVNAFTFGGLTLVVTTGLLAKMGPEEAMGVFAHETGHMIGKHVAGQHEAMEGAFRSSLLGMIVGVGAGILNPAAGVAIISGSMEAGKRTFLSYSRAQESTADQSALRLLDLNHFTARGLEKTFKYFEKQLFLPDHSKIEYLLTHPMPENRLKSIEHHIQTSPYSQSTLPEKYVKPYERIQAKIYAYTQPQQALRKYDQDFSINATYAKMIAYMELGKLKEFSKETASLEPVLKHDPYFIEIKAQAAFEYGDIPSSIRLYEEVNQLLPQASLIKVSLAHALIENKMSKRPDYQKALSLLKEANRVDPTPFGWHLIAIASGKLGDEGEAAYALAEEAVLVGDKKRANYQIKRAMEKLDKNSPFYRRATDIQIAIDYL